MINNKILELIYTVDRAVEFMEVCPLSMLDMKRIFLNEEKEREYLEYIIDNKLEDDEGGLFNFLNDLYGYGDSDIIEEILEKDEEEYYLNYIDSKHIEDSYWEIYKIIKDDKKVKALLKAIKDNTMDGSFNDEDCPVVPLQYIADELEELQNEI